ncbi:unnamed protein product [Lathyrus sativus]|nr:unnamed protein product [Lathyrus sativus]
MLKDNNINWIEDDEEIKTMFHIHFKNIFTMKLNTFDWIHIVQRFLNLNNSTSRFLSSELHNTEIKQALFYMAPWKSLGPDDFLAGFDKKNLE